MKSPHLNSDGYDHVTGAYHCGSEKCEDLLVDRHQAHKGHVVSQWQHFVWTEFPGIPATDERGLTLDGWAQPPRRVHALVPLQNSVHFCIDCFDSLALTFTARACPKCGKPVDTANDYTRADHLFVNGNVKRLMPQVLWHIECLPPIFDTLREEVARRHAPKVTPQPVVSPHPYD